MFNQARFDARERGIKLSVTLRTVGNASQGGSVSWDCDGEPGL